MSSLAKKLQIKSNSRWLLYNAPAGYTALLEPLPDNTELLTATTSAMDGILLFATDSIALTKALQDILSLLKPETYFWVFYPKKNSSIPTDLQMTSNWSILGQYGLRPVTSAAIDETWTGLRFRPEGLVKKSDSSKAAIRETNNYSAYVDTNNKLVSLPDDVKQALNAIPETLARFEKLAYSHKKEYVIWILSAKQEKTRLSRIEKMVQMLLNGKKNPGDK